MNREINESTFTWVLLGAGVVIIGAALLIAIDVYAAANAVKIMPLEVVL